MLYLFTKLQYEEICIKSDKCRNEKSKKMSSTTYVCTYVQLYIGFLVKYKFVEYSVYSVQFIYI